MNEFIKIFKENINSPKAIFMAGGAGSGKSTALKALKPLLKDFKILNADNYVEDKNSPMFGNLAAAASEIKKKDIPNSIKNKQNIIYDTTASTPKTFLPIVNDFRNSGYDVIMIMVYVHPIVSFLRNFKRERKVPTIGVLSTWLGVYSSMEQYKKEFGENFLLISSPASTQEEADMIEGFEESLNKNQLNNFFEELISTGKYSSTFRKDDENISPEEMDKRNKSREKTKELTNSIINNISNKFKEIEDKLEPIQVGELPQRLGQLI